MFYDVRLIYTVGNTGRLQNTRNNVTQDTHTHKHTHWSKIVSISSQTIGLTVINLFILWKPTWFSAFTGNVSNGTENKHNLPKQYALHLLWTVLREERFCTDYKVPAAFYVAGNSKLWVKCCAFIRIWYYSILKLTKLCLTTTLTSNAWSHKLIWECL